MNPQLNVSGAKEDRVAIMDAVARVEAGDLAGIAVYKLDRLSRLAPRQRVELFERIEGQHGEKPGRVKSATEEHDPATPRGRFTRDIFLSLARLQWEEAAEGFADAVANAVANGCHAHAPFGYRKPVGGDGRARQGQPLEVVPAEAAVVVGFCERRARGTSWAELARWADSTGVASPRGGQWTRRTVENIVKNRVYLGAAFYGTEENTDAHPALVGAELFDAANAARGVRPPRGVPALLSGLVRCAGCRHRMRAATVGQRKQLVYRCDRSHGSGVCPAPASVARPLLDTLVQDKFLERYGDVRVEPADTTVGDAVDALRAAERELADYVATISIGDVGAAAFKAGAQARSGRVEECRAQLHRARSATTGVDLGPEGLDIWPDLDIGERRRLLTAGVDSVFVRRAAVPGRNAGLDPDRVRVFWRGEEPDGLPGPGVTTGLAGLDW